MWSLLCSSLTRLFSVNCETRKAIIVIRDLPSLIDVNCAHDPPLRPLITPRKITLLKHKSRTKQRTDAGKNVVISRTPVSRFEEERKLNQNEA